MYVQGSVLPVKTARKADYARMSAQMFEVLKDYGCLSAMENWAEDAPMGEVTSFPRAVKLEDDETVVMAIWVFADKAARDRCMSEGMQDPRLGPLFADMPVDGKRMIFGGFENILNVGTA